MYLSWGGRVDENKVTLFVFSVFISYFNPITLSLSLPISLSSSSSMAFLTGSSVSFKASPQAFLHSSFMSKNYGQMPSVSFWRTNAPKMPALRVICAAKPETVEKIAGIVRKQLALGADTSIVGETKFSELGADSLDTVEIVMELEQEFGVSVEEDKAQEIATIEDAATVIEKLMAKEN